MYITNSESKVKDSDVEKKHRVLWQCINYTLRQTYGYMGITAKVTARELPEYGHCVLYFVDTFWLICGISKVAETFCVQTGADVENVIAPTTNPPSTFRVCKSVHHRIFK